MTPRSEALAYRIWAHCQPIGWDTTVADIADAMGEPVGYVGKLVKAKGWTTRLRASAREVNADIWHNSGHPMGAYADQVDA